jgi:hypothetical protein
MLSGSYLVEGHGFFCGESMKSVLTLILLSQPLHSRRGPEIVTFSPV